MQEQVEQLRREAAIYRMPASQACTELISYVEKRQKNDVLLNGIPIHENPFKEKKTCIVL